MSAPPEWSREEAFACAVVRAAGRVVLERYAGAVRVAWKGKGDPVTEADAEANALIVDAIRREFPGDAVLAEESADDRSRLGRDRLWLVDPLDGTREFIDRNGEFVVLVALAAGGRPVAGAVLHPTSGMLFHARAGGGAWAEDASGARRLCVSDRVDLAGFRLLVSRSHRSKRIDVVRAALGIEKEEPCGSVGLKMARLAAGSADLYVHLGGGTKEWDLAAPEILIAEAGGTVTDLDGDPLLYNRPDVRTPPGFVASNGTRHAEILARLAAVPGLRAGRE
jgi:3'(2'), 5'-bisphosphate nucleotidase